MSDAFDDEEPILNKDDLGALRVSEIVLFFTNHATPLTTTEIYSRFYPDRSIEAADRAFRRDRKVLAQMGIQLKNRAETVSDEGIWELDRDRSLAGSSTISAREALTLDIICRQLVGDPSFPYADELAMALAKIDKSFDGMLPGHTPTQPSTTGIRREICECLEQRCALTATYVDASGHKTNRMLAPYGIFSLHENTYVVAADLTSDGTLVSNGAAHTFRLDRFDSAKKALVKKKEISYEIPEDFSTDDFIRLPFQLGETICTATFSVPPERARDLKHDAAGKGTWSDDGLSWSAPVSDVKVAARWAVGQGIRPVTPAVVVDAWRAVFEGVMHYGN